MNRVEGVLKRIEAEALKPIPPSVGKHHIQTTRHLPIVGPIRGRFIRELVREQQPKYALEIGTLVGYSSIMIASEMRQGKLITIELDPKASGIATDNIREAGLENNILVITGDAKDKIIQLDEKFDFVFIDANKSEYLEYLKLIEEKLNLGAIIIADNVKNFSDEIKNYIEYVKNSNNYFSELKDFGEDAMEITRKIR